jgi:hypothetical protein
MPNQRTAKLRVCARCEWIYKTTTISECAACGFASYGARWVFGDKAYRYAKTQKPWKDVKRRLFEFELEQQQIALSKKANNCGEWFEATTPEYTLRLTYEQPAS